MDLKKAGCKKTGSLLFKKRRGQARLFATHILDPFLQGHKPTQNKQEQWVQIDWANKTKLVAFPSGIPTGIIGKLRPNFLKDSNQNHCEIYHHFIDKNSSMTSKNFGSSHMFYNELRSHDKLDFVYFELDFYCLCSLQKSILKLKKSSLSFLIFPT